MFFSFVLATTLLTADPRADLLNLLGGEWLAQGVYVAAKLDIAHHLQKGPKTARELSLITQVDEEALYRVMSMLASRGVFVEEGDKAFKNSPMSERMAHDHQETLRSLVIFYGEEIHNAFGSLLSSVKTGHPGFEEVYHEPVFDYFKHNPQRALLFQSAMAEKTRAVIQSVIGQIQFEGTVCDIGAGKGHLLYAVLKEKPHLQGIHFDLPEVITAISAPPPRVELQSGSFFDSVPNADIYLMKSILHDWSDEKAIEILQTCHSSIPEKSVLYVIEPVMIETETHDYAKLMDVLMLTVTGGRERSLDQYKALFEKAGFVLTNVLPTSTEFRILELKRLQIF